MSGLLVLVVAVVLLVALQWLRRPGAGGSVGRAVRESDHAAWGDAVERKREELDALLQARPRT